jgi:hypothetical protein
LAEASDAILKAADDRGNGDTTDDFENSPDAKGNGELRAIQKLILYAKRKLG